MSSAPMRPKIAPEAPTVTANAELNQSAPAEPGEPRDEVDEQESRRPESLLDDRPEPVEREHVEGEMEDAAVQEHGVASRHQSPSETASALQGPVVEQLAAGKVDAASLRRR